MNRIKQLRDELKISQSELGKKLNKTQQQISLYENGTNELDLEGYMILSELFDCNIEYIAGKSDIRKSKLNEINDHLLKIGLNMKDYKPPTEEQKKQIEEFAKYVLKDNKKEN